MAAPTPSPFDVEQFRSLPNRYAVVRTLDRPTIVLGSAQRADAVVGPRAAQSGVDVVHRRGGGGAVLVRPGDHLWIEVWIPQADPLWEADVTSAASWVGAWWSDALRTLGTGEYAVHRGPAAPGAHGALVCFSGRGPGEVFSSGRKVMGISQWRSREGALFHTCAYTRWDPAPLIDLLAVDPTTSAALVEDLRHAAVGLEDLDDGPLEVTALRDTLLSSLPVWGRDGPIQQA